VKAITLTQPWATLVAIGAKQVETRSWKTNYRGTVAIHAAKAFPGYAKDFSQNSDLCRRVLGWPDPPNPLTQGWLDDIAYLIRSLPLGQVIATARIVDCLPASELSQGLSVQELEFGNYAAGRFGFVLQDIQRIDPAPARGALSFWEWTR